MRHFLKFHVVLFVLTITLLMPDAVHGGPMHVAARSNNVDGARAALEKDGLNAINDALPEGITPLHVAAAMNSRDVADFLIGNGAKLNATTTGGFTPLHWAASRDSADVAALLIEKGANINAATPDGITPLHWAAGKNASRVVRLLLLASVDVLSKTRNGMTAIHWAVMKDSQATAEMLAFRLVGDKEAEKAVLPAAEPAPPTDTDDDPVNAMSNAMPPPAGVTTNEPSDALAARVSKLQPTEGSAASFVLGSGEAIPLVWIATLKLWIGRNEVSNGQYKKFDPEHSSLFWESFSLDGKDQPVVNVTWKNASAFCSWLNKSHADQIPKGYAFRLPTRDEWVAIARCGTGRKYPWGDTLPPTYGNFPDDAARRALSAWAGIENYDDGFVVTCPVDKSGENEWGVRGMAGNVWEWCEDWYDTDQQNKIKQGGSWDFDRATSFAVDFRGFDHPDMRDGTVGFRVVLAPRPTPET